MLKFLQKNWPWTAIVFAMFVIPFLLYMFVGKYRILSSEKAPNFALRNFDGTVIYMEELRGRPIVLNFWAAWCTFCKIEMPMLEKFYQEYKDRGLVVVGVHRSETESRETAVNFAKEYNINYPLVSDPNDNIFHYFAGGSNLVPATVFIDGEGFIKERIFGPRHEDQFRKLFLQIINP